VDIRKKTVIILCVAIAYLILIFLILSQTVVLDGFFRVEEQNAHKDTNRALLALGNDINTLDAVAHDWASRDDTRAFLLAEDPGASWSRLDPDTFERLQFNYILLFNTSGTMVSGKGFDLDQNQEKAVPPALAALSSSYPRIPAGISSGYGTMGIIQGPEGPLMLAVRPVFTDPDSGQAAGYILMGRNLDAAELSRLSAIAQLPLDLQPYGNPDLPADFRKSVPQFPPSSSPFVQREGKEALLINAPTYITPLNDTTLSTYSLIRDLSGRPVLILKVSLTRDIYDTGKTTTLYFVNLFIIAGLVIGLAILLLLEKTVLSRVLHLTGQLSEIAKTRDFSSRVDPSGDDEIRTLADNINSMLCELENFKEMLWGRLILSEDKYQIFFESITDPVIVYQSGEPGTVNRIIEANDAAMDLLGYSREELTLITPRAIVTREVHEEDPELFLVGKQEGFVRYETSFRTKEGKLIPVEINARKFTKFGESAILLIARDITDRKMAEKALIQANKKLNLLTFVTFNEIQNALFAMKGYVSLQKDLPHDPRADGYLAKEEELFRRFSLFLDFAKNYQDLGMKPPRWQNVYQTFIFAISRQDFSKISRRIGLDNLEIYADSLLERVFFILADNILAHGEHATQLTMRYVETGDCLLLFFEDNGAGVPESLKEKIFQRDSGSQNGVGLFFAREILEITGITIRETGTFGSGARFEITLPRGTYRFAGKPE
jgi:PAS domain S-box-containing protein